MRDLLSEQAAAGRPMRSVTAGDIAHRRYPAERPDPDLVIQTSGQPRMSNFQP